MLKVKLMNGALPQKSGTGYHFCQINTEMLVNKKIKKIL